MKRAPTALALAIAAAMFALYRSTLLPDFDLGDTPSFQVMAGRPNITPRDAYPLYYAVGQLFVPFGGTRAHAMNVASAAAAAAACGVLALVAMELSGSVAAGAAAALLIGGSYTFWSQAVIAEVYALHILLVGLTLLLLLRWSERQTLSRLALLFAVYALAFGNHLSMVLLAPAIALFLLTSASAGWRSIVSPRVIGIAAGAAALGALQYAWNFRALWKSTSPPRGIGEALGMFWFDVTKADWRETMVLGVPVLMALERLRMYAFDVLQQVGWIGAALAAIGAVWLFRTNWRRGLLVAGVYGVTAGFAFGYNVGDAHVFFLPATAMLALLAGCGIAGISRNRWVALLAIAVVGLRIHRDYPALDRSRDDRPTALLDALTTGLNDGNAVLLTDLNWQIQNGLTYFASDVRPELAYAPLAEILAYAPAFVRDNFAINRDVVLTERARGPLEKMYGGLFRTAPDSRAPRVTLDDLTHGLAPGTRYVLAVLRPAREFPIDERDFGAALQRLTNGHSSSLALDRYAVVAGEVGDPPVLVRSALRPFKARATIAGVAVEVRMESWLDFDTIRRMGFGHVIANRNHALIVERGISFVTLDAEGLPIGSGYAAGIYAREGRHLIQTGRLP